MTESAPAATKLARIARVARDPAASDEDLAEAAGLIVDVVIAAGPLRQYADQLWDLSPYASKPPAMPLESARHAVRLSASLLVNVLAAMMTPTAEPSSTATRHRLLTEYGLGPDHEERLP
jgi:hypothetical protein